MFFQRFPKRVKDFLLEIGQGLPFSKWLLTVLQHIRADLLQSNRIVFSVLNRHVDRGMAHQGHDCA